MTIYCWLDYAYYDGLLTFSQLLLVPDPDSPLLSINVKWLQSEAAYEVSS